MVGTLLASYALVAAVATMPLVRWTATWPRRRTLMWTLACLTVSQLISALAPTFAVLAVGRVLCALTHGLMWSVIAPIGARLVPATHAGRATTAVYVGTTLALVVGSPLTAAMSELWGWRHGRRWWSPSPLRRCRPPHGSHCRRWCWSAAEIEGLRTHQRHHRNSRLVT